VKRVKNKSNKAVIASMGTVAASGGYYIAAATDRIIANPGTLTGSIGVIMEMANFEGLMKKGRGRRGGHQERALQGCRLAVYGK
jgi:protease-4